MKQNKHTFAVFYNELQKEQLITITEKNIINRIANVLRLVIDEQIILFNHKVNITGIIESIDKKSIRVRVIESMVNVPLTPAVHLYVGLLKKESFEEVLYTATELGATSITPIISSKIHKNWWDKKFLERLHAIIIAAAEQSKNYQMPQLNDPLKFNDFITSAAAFETKLFFEPSGKNVIDMLGSKHSKQLHVVIGPEGDFSDEEKQQLKDAGFMLYALTPTILRSVQAVAVGLGVIRSLFNNEEQL